MGFHLGQLWKFGLDLDDTLDNQDSCCVVCSLLGPEWERDLHSGADTSSSQVLYSSTRSVNAMDCALCASSLTRSRRPPGSHFFPSFCSSASRTKYQLS